MSGDDTPQTQEADFDGAVEPRNEIEQGELWGETTQDAGGAVVMALAQTCAGAISFHRMPGLGDPWDRSWMEPGGKATLEATEDGGGVMARCWNIARCGEVARGDSGACSADICGAGNCCAGSCCTGSCCAGSCGAGFVWACIGGAKT